MRVLVACLAARPCLPPPRSPATSNTRAPVHRVGTVSARDVDPAARALWRALARACTPVMGQLLSPTRSQLPAHAACRTRWHVGIFISVSACPQPAKTVSGLGCQAVWRVPLAGRSGVCATCREERGHACCTTADATGHMRETRETNREERQREKKGREGRRRRGGERQDGRRGRSWARR
jgi:hypothetical protein